MKSATGILNSPNQKSNIKLCRLMGDFPCQLVSGDSSIDSILGVDYFFTQLGSLVHPAQVLKKYTDTHVFKLSLRTTGNTTAWHFTHPWWHETWNSDWFYRDFEFLVCYMIRIKHLYLFSFIIIQLGSATFLDSTGSGRSNFWPGRTGVPWQLLAFKSNLL